jgi:plasmid rolling circle replication initiator protein Rep
VTEEHSPGCNDFLTDYSPKDKPWDAHKGHTARVGTLYDQGGYQRLSERLGNCAEFLRFGWLPDHETGELTLKLSSARFCRVRHCPICQWRRSLMWIARFLKKLPAIESDYPKARWLLLTLTVRNCSVTELRDTLTVMNRAWQRMVQKKVWPGIGFARSTEVTRGADGTAHPHFHVLVMVEPKYFQGAYYLSQERWTSLWQEVLKVDYKPIVDVRAIKSNATMEGDSNGAKHSLAEVFKYTVKPQDLEDAEFLFAITQQLHKTRAIALGGVLKAYISEEEPEDLIVEEATPELQEAIKLTFGWRERLERYQRVN